MRSIDSGEARSQFYRLLDEAAQGDSITITKRGTPVARLIPIDASAPKGNDVLERLRTFRKGNALDGLSIRKLIEEGRKY